MGIVNRITRVFQANINDMIDRAEDPEKVLEQSIRDMTDNVVKIRQATAQAIAAKKTLERQYENNVQEAELWHKRAQLAISQNSEDLAREALHNKAKNIENANNLRNSIDNQSAQVTQMADNLRVLESKIAEAKTKKDMLKARVKAAEAQRQLQNVMSNVNNNSAFNAFERMENKVVQMEAMAEALPELNSLNNSKWNDLDKSANNDLIEAELESLKAGINPNTPKLNPSKADPDSIEVELEKIKNSL